MTSGHMGETPLTLATLEAELEQLFVRYHGVAVIGLVAGAPGETVPGNDRVFHLTDARLVIGNHDDFVELFTPWVMAQMRDMQAKAREKRNQS